MGAIAQTGACADTSLPEYLATHYLPNWYPFSADLTPEPKIYNLNADLAVKIWIDSVQT